MNNIRNEFEKPVWRKLKDVVWLILISKYSVKICDYTGDRLNHYINDALNNIHE